MSDAVRVPLYREAGNPHRSAPVSQGKNQPIAESSRMVAEGSVMVGWVHGGWVRAEFMTSVLKLTAQDSPAGPLVGQVCDVTAGALVGAARTLLTEQFLASQQDWLFMADSDVVFTPGTLLALAGVADAEERPVLTGLCPTADGQGGWKAAIYDGSRDENGEVRFTFKTRWAEDALVRVGGCGAACLLVHQRVFEDISAAEDGEPCWWREIPRAGGTYGEDLSFSLRCAEAGIPVWAHTGAMVTHMKTVALGQAR